MFIKTSNKNYVETYLHLFNTRKYQVVLTPPFNANNKQQQIIRKQYQIANDGNSDEELVSHRQFYALESQG